MKKLLLIVCSLTVAFAALAAGRTDYARLNGTMCPIDLPDSVQKWWPDSLTPYFLNHVGRHGARFLSSESKVVNLESFLRKEKAIGNLSAKGVKALALLDTVRARTAGRWGALTELGRMEERRIAEITLKLCPELFKKGEVRSISSYVPRVVESQFSFLMPLADYSSHLDINASSGRGYDKFMRPFSYFKEYEAYRKDSGPWYETFSAQSEKFTPAEPIMRLLKKNGSISDKEARKLSLDFYGILQGMEASGIDCNPADWYTLEEYENCAKVSNLQRYLRNGVNKFTTLPARSTVPLLLDILEAPAEDSTCVAALRFGHDETLMPLLSLIGLKEGYAPDADLTPDAVWESWNTARTFPLAANLQIIYLRAPSGNEYVAMMYNERPVLPYPDAPALIVPLPAYRTAMLTRLWQFTLPQ